jgi:hypothetical protein
VLEGNEYLKKKAFELGLDRADILVDVQRLLEDWYPGLVRAVSLNKGVLRLVTPNASVAGELRLRQVELMAAFTAPIERLQISIG